MSASSFPASSPAAATVTTDPTSVVGRRAAAFVLDLLLYTLVMAFIGPTPLSPLAEYSEGARSGACEDVRDTNDDIVGCTQLDDRIYVTEAEDLPVQLVVFVVVVALYVGVQGATGTTPGKAIFGVRVVDEAGRPPGFARSLGRSVLWIVDGQPFGLPLVGFVTALTTTGHRRVGDMAARTYVVPGAHRGPVVLPAPPLGPPPPPWGPPPPSWGPPAGPPTPEPPPPAPAGQPVTDAEPSPSPDAGTAVPAAAGPGAEPAPPGHAEGAPPAGPDRPDVPERTAASTTPPAGTAATGPDPSTYAPQWDAARGTYIVWDPSRGQWLGWDATGARWLPL